MICFDRYFSFTADQVVYIEENKNSSNYPYSLSVSFRNGKTITVNYKDETERNKVKQTLMRNIERELHQQDERIENRLFAIENDLKRIDKRQLRVWRQLRSLLKLPMEIDT